MFNKLIFLASCCLFLASAPTRAADKRDEPLLRLVPDDVGLCLVVQDLRGHAQAFLASPFFERLSASPFAGTLRKTHELRKLAAFDRELRSHLDLTTSRIRDDLLGDAVVLAYRPAPSDKPEQEEGLLLVRARDAELLARTIERFNTIQKDSGELKELEARTHKGIAYTCRRERGSSHFYYLQGAVFAFTSQEGIMKRMLERVADKEASLLSRQLAKLGVDDALATLWINPRAFDTELELKASQARGPEAFALKKIQSYWKALDGVALSATLGRTDVELALTLSARDGELPDAARKFFAPEEKPSELWSRFPDNAWVTMVARLDVPATLEVFADFFPDEARKELRQGVQRTLGAALGLDIVQDVLPNLGPDWGVCLLPPAGDRLMFPALIAALRVRPGDETKPVGRALYDGLHTVGIMAIFAHNKNNADPISLRTDSQDKVEVKYLGSERGQVVGIQPAFALKDGFLLLASTPDVIRRFQPGARQLEVGTMLQVSVKEMRSFVRQRLDDLSALLAEKHNISKEEAQRRLQTMLSVAQLVDRVTLSRHAAPGRVSIALRIRVQEPLRR